WLISVLKPETVAFLFQGDLRLTYRSGVHEYLRLSYTFKCDRTPITITAGMPAFFMDGGFCVGEPPETNLRYNITEEKVINFFAARNLNSLQNILRGHLGTSINPGLRETLVRNLAESNVCLEVRKVPPQLAFHPAHRWLSD